MAACLQCGCDMFIPDEWRPVRCRSCFHCHTASQENKSGCQLASVPSTSTYTSSFASLEQSHSNCNPTVLTTFLAANQSSSLDHFPPSPQFRPETRQVEEACPIAFHLPFDGSLERAIQESLELSLETKAYEEALKQTMKESLAAEVDFLHAMQNSLSSSSFKRISSFTDMDSVLTSPATSANRSWICAPTPALIPTTVSSNFVELSVPSVILGNSCSSALRTSESSLPLTQVGMDSVVSSSFTNIHRIPPPPPPPPLRASTIAFSSLVALNVPQPPLQGSVVAPSSLAVLNARRAPPPPPVIVASSVQAVRTPPPPPPLPVAEVADNVLEIVTVTLSSLPVSQEPSITECGVCMVETATVKFKKCNHSFLYCADCLEQRCVLLIQNSDAVVCDFKGCKVRATYMELKSMFAKAKRIDLIPKLEIALGGGDLLPGGQNLVYCCVCNSGKFCGAEKVMICPDQWCSGRTCIQHKHPAFAKISNWRKGHLTTENGALCCVVGEYEAARSSGIVDPARFTELLEDEKWKQSNCRTCPKCSRVIEHIGGCDLMCCGDNYHGGSVQKGCGMKFLWSATKPYMSPLQAARENFSSWECVCGAFHPLSAKHCATCQWVCTACSYINLRSVAFCVVCYQIST